MAWEDLPRADAIVAAVAHRGFLELGPEDFAKKLVKGGCFIDVKANFSAESLAEAGYKVWRL
jgi:UDP-N-acetyl-D-galactosamine dehydrogenase